MKVERTHLSLVQSWSNRLEQKTNSLIRRLQISSLQTTAHKIQMNTQRNILLITITRYLSGKKKFFIRNKITLENLETESQSSKIFEWERKSIMNLFSKTYYYCTATIENQKVIDKFEITYQSSAVVTIYKEYIRKGLSFWKLIKIIFKLPN